MSGFLEPVKRAAARAKDAIAIRPTEIAEVKQPSRELDRSNVRGNLSHIRPKQIRKFGELVYLDPELLMRMIRRVTQNIGEYNDVDNVYAKYIVPALRKARGDMVSDLETHFRIHWRLDEQGRSDFYYS